MSRPAKIVDWQTGKQHRPERSGFVCLGGVKQTETLAIGSETFMGVPKRKPSKSRQRMRRAYNSVLSLPQLSTCPQCAAPYIPHRVCPSCGYYKGRQVLTITAGA